MPNGFHGSKEEWEKITEPLLGMDANFTTFASDHGLTKIRNYHNWPCYQLNWSDQGIEKSIQLTSDESGEKVGVAIVAWNDRQGMRFSKHVVLRKNVAIDEVQKELDPLLNQAFRILSSWTDKDLK